MKSRPYTIPNFLYDASIYNYVRDLVEQGYKCYNKVPVGHKEHIITLIIDVLGTDAYNLIIGDNFDKTLEYFSKFLRTAKSEDAYDLLSQMRKNALEQYEYDLERLFLDIAQDQEETHKYELGLFPFVDRNTGETEWRRRA